MALFHRRPQASNPVNYVTVGMTKTLLLVGLGNPGKQYDGTRHNIGFAVIDEFVNRTEDLGPWKEQKNLKCLESSGRLGDTKVLAIKPTTYMNNSGEAVRAAVDFYKIQVKDIIVVHDEIDVDFGQIRTRLGGGAAGHNGIKSIIQHASEDFGRVRVGIGPKTPEQIDSADFVLQKFTQDEQAKLPDLLKETTAILSEVAYGSALGSDTRSFLL
jgi:PTH1 family peptidyl-tRNA hydrolase